jgi:hypothetical protein
VFAKLTSERIEVGSSIQEVNALFYQRGWTDGLPIIPPTDEEVRKMVEFVGRDPQEVIAALALKWQSATVEKIAINAVMAGCSPEYMPVIIAAVEAIADPLFSLYSSQTTTHPCAPLVVVNGPIRHKLDINSGAGAFGPGWKANATIGRAIRLILINIGGAVPGKTGMSTQAQPAKFTYCVGENEEKNPWGSLQVDRGYKASDSTVTVFAAENPHNIHDHSSTTGSGLLKTIANSMISPGCNNSIFPLGELVLALGPEHVAAIAADGFSREDVKRYIFENARVPVSMLSEENLNEVKSLPMRRGEIVNGCIPIVQKSSDVIIIVVGGAGKHSSFIPTLSIKGRSVTRPVKMG